MFLERLESSLMMIHNITSKKLRTVDKEQKFYKLTQIIENEDLMAGTINLKRKPCGWNDKY